MHHTGVCGLLYSQGTNLEASEIIVKAPKHSLLMQPTQCFSSGRMGNSECSVLC